MLTNGARASRLVINKFELRYSDVKGITENIMGWELDEVGKRGGSTRLVRMGAGCETPEPRARRNARSGSDRTRVLVAGVCLAPCRVRKAWQMTPPYV